MTCINVICIIIILLLLYFNMANNELFDQESLPNEAVQTLSSVYNTNDIYANKLITKTLNVSSVDNIMYKGRKLQSYLDDISTRFTNLNARISNIINNGVYINNNIAIRSVARRGYLADRGGWKGQPTHKSFWEGMSFVPLSF